MARPKPLEGRARLVQNLELGPEIAYLTLEAPWIAETARPGQFVMVGCNPSGGSSFDPLLSRPLAVAGIEGDRINLLMAIKGRGTALLAGYSPGTELTLRGPLGNGFPQPGHKSLLLVAGGLGAPPLLFAHRYYSGQKDLDLKFILGIPNRAFIPLVEHLSGLAPGLEVFSEDGCMGAQGNVCNGLPAGPEEVWTCGPTPMYRAMLDRLNPKVPLWVSLETRMGCGYGGCMGCVVPTRQGNLRACCEGPVFNGREVLWHELS